LSKTKGGSSKLGAIDDMDKME